MLACRTNAVPIQNHSKAARFLHKHTARLHDSPKTQRASHGDCVYHHAGCQRLAKHPHPPQAPPTRRSAFLLTATAPLPSPAQVAMMFLHIGERKIPLAALHSRLNLVGLQPVLQPAERLEHVDARKQLGREPFEGVDASGVLAKLLQRRRGSLR